MSVEVPNIRKRLGLLVLEDESDEAGLVRIAADQEWRSTQRLLGQIKTAKARKSKPKLANLTPILKEPKVAKPPKVPRIPKPRKPRVKKVKHEHVQVQPQDETAPLL